MKSKCPARLREINTDLYDQDKSCFGLYSEYWLKKTRGIDGSAKKNSQYFPRRYSTQPYLLVDGKKGPIHIIIYPQVVLEKNLSDTGL